MGVRSTLLLLLLRSDLASAITCTKNRVYPMRHEYAQPKLDGCKLRPCTDLCTTLPNCSCWQSRGSVLPSLRN